MNTIFAGKKGFTLVEVIVVLLILSVVMMAVMSLFIPVKRSSVVQSQVADIQGGMRVALDNMAKDFRNAGFLIDIDTDPIELVSPQEITILTRAGAVGIVSPAGIPDTAAGNFELSDEQQGNYFPVGTFVGVFSPMVRDAYVGGIACRVVAQDAGDKKLIQLKDKNNADIQISQFKSNGQTALILVPLANGTVSPAATIKSITYAFVEETVNGKVVKFLRRTTEGSTRYLARGVTGTFVPKETTMADGNPAVNRVIVNMTGQTVAAGNDAVGSQKTRTLSTVFNLRNI